MVLLYRLITALAFLFACPVAAQAIDLCSGPDRAERKVTCIVDGDTGWENGVKWRMAGVDTPEYAPHAECTAEIEMAGRSTNRLIELMDGGYEIVWLEDKGRFARDLVRVRLSDGTYAGERLIAEGLAQPWPNEGNAWCDW